MTEWTQDHFDQRISARKREIRKLRHSILVSILDDLPLLVLNCYLLWTYNEIHGQWSYALSIVLSSLLFGWHLSYLRQLRDAQYRLVRFQDRVDKAKQKKCTQCGADKILKLGQQKDIAMFASLETVICDMRDRKSGSAGMPRPISYAVFCLKKKN
eukprot:TRINITY_DN8254_c0_g1_i8.p1 TRINITY_DN8254_c0_g1~~TRINITY_DN8254_c0_g1_i8.p1  ORF type:complete len:156 (-),score=12.02 TRINITY_DN8254_c0_g1_i8:8-475(-)